MNAEQLDEIYSEICHRMTAAGEDGALLYLSRLALLLAHEVDDAERVRTAVEAAATPVGR
ncbi:hypothetical protein [Streptomyces sp. NPDC057438]|uniref:hypothetical protein n=1 Tax=Streptomyces sp. NPDC057438 TaxID=3346133 RepID=UPI0036A229FD